MSKTTAQVGGIRIINTHPDVYTHNHEKESQSNHILGARLLCAPLSKGCILIPKCASTSLKNIGLNLDYEWTETQYEYDPNLKFMVTIREPWERYISGYYEYLCRSMGIKFLIGSVKPFDPPDLTIQQIMNFCDDSFLNNKILFDEHTMPQYYFVKPFINNLITLINREDIEEYYPLWFGDDYPPHYMYARSHEELYNIVKDYLNEKREKDSKWFSKWMKYFEGDYQLYTMDSGMEYRLLLNRS